MARRYSGNVTVDLLWDDRGYYKGRVTWPGGSFDATGLRLSPHDAGRLAADSAEAYDEAAKAAISFAANDHEEVWGHANREIHLTHESWKVRRDKAHRWVGHEGVRRNPSPPRMAGWIAGQGLPGRHHWSEVFCVCGHSVGAHSQEKKGAPCAHVKTCSCKSFRRANPAHLRATDYAGIAAALGARTSRALGHNTEARRDHDGSIRVRYHKTDIAVLYPDGSVRLDSGGWRTSTTKARMDMILRRIGYGLGQDKFRWYVHGPGGRVPFEDGMVVGGGTRANPKYLRDPFGPFNRDQLRRDAAGSGSCSWCGQQRKTLYTYGMESPMGRYHGAAKGRFCGLDCFKSYHS